jgi:hypothetical protein
MDASAYLPSANVQFEGNSGLLTLVYQGAVSRQELDVGLEQIRLAVDDSPVNAIILDVRNSVPVYSSADLVECVEQMLDEITPKRCAFVSGQARAQTVNLIETVSFPYAVRVQAFSTVDAARDWVSAAL